MQIQNRFSRRPETRYPKADANHQPQAQTESVTLGETLHHTAVKWGSLTALVSGGMLAYSALTGNLSSTARLAAGMAFGGSVGICIVASNQGV